MTRFSKRNRRTNRRPANKQMSGAMRGG